MVSCTPLTAHRLTKSVHLILAYKNFGVERERERHYNAKATIHCKDDLSPVH